MTHTRRHILARAAAAAVATSLAEFSFLRSTLAAAPATPAASADTTTARTRMRYRQFGSTGLQISEVAFGSWGIGNGYGSVDRAQALNALAKAEELGCNFVDTAGVYGDAESTLGEFLRGRRQKWHVATKYSGQDGGLEKLLNEQLTRLGTDAVDFYQLHWAPRPDSKDGALYEQLYRVKKAGKARFIGVSLYTAADIDFVLKETQLDGFQCAFSLLDPNPMLARLELIRQKRPAILIRSALKEGFLAGKYKANATFPDPNDQRHKWSAKQIADTVSSVERFRFLQAEAGGSLATAALRYPLSFPEISAVLAGTKNEAQASENFGKVPGATLSAASLERIQAIQRELGLLGADSWLDKLKSLFRS